MLRYTLQRLGWALVTLWVVITLTFGLMHVIPGDPFAKEGNMPPGVYENLRAYYNLDKPLIVQYGLYLKSLLQLDFGPSLKSSAITVNDYIAQGFPISFYLGLQALAIGVTLGLIFGVIAALYHNKWPDYLSMILAIVGLSVPSFFLATVFINYIAVEMNIFPPSGWGTWQHTVLPSLALAAMPMAFIARLMRSSMLEVLGQDYIKTAKSKGLTRNIVIIKHTLRNAILPVVTVLGIITANLVTGSFVVEHIFGIPGMGEMFVKGIFNRDYPVILGSTVFYSAILIFLIFVVDVLYTWIDPRIKVAGGSK
ncbi:MULTISPECIES: ABC transporter permease [Aneurinibacillus]|uniref:ABC transporter permease n=1 Tax=Aneurinibacillus thermoaerophilus TaxID=143495 RepID=A0A1G7XNZ4_ANETH|nr:MULTISPECIES: ABC transporter permease [Aneurinibacillus]AMA73670.1 peptide ABC transporter permease [Aneurinibacillus sp. XH2]MED0675073.1 ABC transporter permease [Aneurinibacillus thermoaerophilus]MED0737474.1 ABC transporter permease [Aneurinibacillus thermoaerophilus]QYY43764.1 ABC transporter permease [Aneurinibacillus thermoaerophilus]SDG85925.1 dipeptide transport system permease protein [Aneurinibacillus thermoaerophilus]